VNSKPHASPGFSNSTRTPSGKARTSGVSTRMSPSRQTTRATSAANPSVAGLLTLPGRSVGPLDPAPLVVASAHPTSSVATTDSATIRLSMVGLLRESLYLCTPETLQEFPSSVAWSTHKERLPLIEGVSGAMTATPHAAAQAAQ